LSLQLRLYTLVLLALLPALAIQVYGSVVAYREREAEVRAEALRLAQYVAGELDRIIAGHKGVMVAMGELPALRARRRGLHALCLGPRP
jgi:hypothetical protein